MNASTARAPALPRRSRCFCVFAHAGRGGGGITSIQEAQCPRVAIRGIFPLDAAVNTADLLILLGAWGGYDDKCVLADLDLSGAVDTDDLLVLLGNWG